MESIESINRQLRDLFGVDSITGLPIWRVVWSEDQIEKRMSKYTASGIELLYPQVVEVPKYRQFLKERHILERLSVVPPGHLELSVEQLSYEPIHVFENKNGALPPKVEVAKYIIDTLYAAAGKSSLAKYKEDDDREARLLRLEEELFGNETDTGDALAHKEAIVVPKNYEKV